MKNKIVLENNVLISRDCTKCGKHLAASCFFVSKHKPYGYGEKCKTCFGCKKLQKGYVKPVSKLIGRTSKKRMSLEEAQKRLSEIKEGITIIPISYSVANSACLVIHEGYSTPHKVILNNIFKVKKIRHPEERSKVRSFEQSGISIDEIKMRLSDTKFKLVEISYTIVSNKIMVLDTESDELFWCSLRCLIKGTTKHSPKLRKIKHEQTMIERYGVKNPLQIKEVLLKVMKNSNNSTIIPHWKTGEELVTKASYEKKVVEWLNRNKIDFIWQPTKFETSVGYYFPDLYLCKEDKYVEIKGYFREKSQIKCYEFKLANNDFEVWDQPRLKQLNRL